MYDFIIIGGGPSGSTLSYYLSKQGYKCLIIEKMNFPRYCIGESLLPYNIEIFKDMDFEKKIIKAGYIRKEGAIFGESNGENITRIDFSNGIEEEYSYAYQVPRDEFDKLLLEHSLEQGTELLKAEVIDVIKENDKVTGVVIRDEQSNKKELHAKLVIDASGRKFFLSRKFGLLENDEFLSSVAVYGLFENINTQDSHEKSKKGDIIILAFEYGWFWLIPFSDGRTSVGVVTDYVHFENNKDKKLEDFFYYSVENASGRVKKLMENAKSLNKIRLLQNFSKHSEKVAGPGWVLAGDAAKFVDPVYSAGVLIAMTSARKIADIIIETMKKGDDFIEETFKDYKAILDTAYEVVLPFIHCYRNPLFQRILFNPPKNGGETVKMITTVLAGCFFKPDLIEKEHNNFWSYMKMRGVEPFDAKVYYQNK